jgi:hypothetical protein
MVLDPTIGTTRRSVRFSRVLIDGGSSINILYRDTARKLGIQEAELPLQRKTIFLTNHFRHVKANFRQGLLRGDKI